MTRDKPRVRTCDVCGHASAHEHLCVHQIRWTLCDACHGGQLNYSKLYELVELGRHIDAPDKQAAIGRLVNAVLRVLSLNDVSSTESRRELSKAVVPFIDDWHRPTKEPDDEA